jgi:hypothetical protein
MNNNLFADAIYSLQDVAEEINDAVYYYHVGSAATGTDFSAPVIDSFETALNQFITTTTMLIRIRSLWEGRDANEDYLRRLEGELTTLATFIDPVTSTTDGPNQTIVNEVLESEIHRLKQENELLQSKLDLLNEVQAA